MGQQELPGTVNYFLGNDPAEWHTNIPTYAQVQYHDVYPGIDLVYYGDRQQLEYDFVVAAGADPVAIALRFEGADRLAVDAAGDLLVDVGGQQIVHRQPVLYQDGPSGRQAVAGGYVVQGERQVGFAVGAYDASRPLVLDPVLLVYSTYLGGSGGDDGLGIAVDAAGNAYVAGSAPGILPTTPGAFQPTLGGIVGQSDAFVAKLNASGTALVYATYLGGTSNDDGLGIAVDSAGNAYVTGHTFSSNFPTTVGALSRSLAAALTGAMRS